MNTRYRKFWAALICTVCVAAPAAAQTPAYPSRPITRVFGFTPGGISDVMARALAARLTMQMGQTVIVDNKPGAATTIAAAYVAGAAPDGPLSQHAGGVCRADESGSAQGDRGRPLGGRRVRMRLFV